MEKKELTKTSVQDAVETFYHALQLIFTGDVSPMKDIWSHASDVSYLSPRGDIRIGWDEVLKEWKLQAELHLKGSITAKNIHIIEDENIAIVQNDEEGINDIKGKTAAVRIRATNIFRRENGQWKMISHHTDLISNLGE